MHIRSLLPLFLAVVTVTVRAQDPVSATWPMSNPGTGGTGLAVTVSGHIEGVDERLQGTEINQYTGPNNSQRVRMAGTGNTWPASQTTQIDTVYIQFSAGPPTGFTVTVDSITMALGAASSSYLKANLYYSTDSTFATHTLIPYTTGNDSNYLISGGQVFISAAPNVMLNEGEKIYFRIYPWLHNQITGLSGKYVCPQNVVIKGTSTARSVPASVRWPLEADEDPVISGLLSAGPETFSDSLYLYGFTNVGGTNCAWMATVSHEWPAQTAPDTTRYVQYAVTPQVGGTLTVDSISVSLGAAFTNNLRAGVFFSTDPTFATRTALIPDTALVASALVLHNFGVHAVIATGETLFVRILPYNTQAEGWAKLMYVSNMRIVGSTTGLAILPATVSTASITYISTTHATGGGNVSADGGGPVMERGVCWDTTASPTVGASHTVDGGGTGSFVSAITGLLPGTLYYVRAYATNESGTAYGAERTFTARATLDVPTLTTNAVSNILTTTARSGGTITDWGGDPVTQRGVCWNTSGSPTIADSRTTDGQDIGSFTSILYGLTPNTQYHVRSYGVNTIGAGYGPEVTFTTQVPAPPVTKVVSPDSTGDYTSVQAAFEAVPDNYTGTYTIYVKRGRYYEKLLLGANKVNVVLVGEDRDSTILTYDDYSGRVRDSVTIGTSTSYSVAIDASDFVARNITFENTSTVAQAVALRANGDRQTYYDCNLLGYQDTYYTWGGSATGRVYHNNCLIRGSVDFIFGRDIVLFDSCVINVNRNGGTLTAASTEAPAKYGYVFRDCTIKADSIGFDGNPITNFYLGRPWQASPRTVFLRTYQPAQLNAAGWLAWNVTPALYAENNCSGPGYQPSQRVAWSSQLPDSVAALYTTANIFARDVYNPAFGFDWTPPARPPLTSVEDQQEGANVPAIFRLDQNYPNPFNPETTIRFSVEQRGFTTLTVYNLLGQRVATLFNGMADPGQFHTVRFNGVNLASGVYVYRLENGGNSVAKKLMLMK